MCVCITTIIRRVHEFSKLGAPTGEVKVQEILLSMQCSCMKLTKIFKECYKYNPIISTKPKRCSNDNPFIFKTIICDKFLDYGITEK